MWNGWYITVSLVIVFHLILIMSHLVNIIKDYREAMANGVVTGDNKSPETIEMHDFGRATLPGIQINIDIDMFSKFKIFESYILILSDEIRGVVKPMADLFNR